MSRVGSLQRENRCDGGRDARVRGADGQTISDGVGPPCSQAVILPDSRKLARSGRGEGGERGGERREGSVVEGTELELSLCECGGDIQWVSWSAVLEEDEVGSGTGFEFDVVEAGKALASTVIDLLSDNASNARKITDNFEAPLTIPEYLDTLRGFRRTETWDGH